MAFQYVTVNSGGMSTHYHARSLLFLQNNLVQKYITKLLIMTIIKRKEILTTREILNFIYDITVPQDFSYSELGESLSDDGGMLKQFLRGMTPKLMFDQEGVSSLMDHVRENDPVLFRDENSDDFAVEYYVSTDVAYCEAKRPALRSKSAAFRF